MFHPAPLPLHRNSYRQPHRVLISNHITHPIGTPSAPTRSLYRSPSAFPSAPWHIVSIIYNLGFHTYSLLGARTCLARTSTAIIVVAPTGRRCLRRSCLQSHGHRFQFCITLLSQWCFFFKLWSSGWVLIGQLAIDPDRQHVSHWSCKSTSMYIFLQTWCYMYQSSHSMQCTFIGSRAKTMWEVHELKEAMT